MCDNTVLKENLSFFVEGMLMHFATLFIENGSRGLIPPFY